MSFGSLSKTHHTHDNSLIKSYSLHGKLQCSQRWVPRATDSAPSLRLSVHLFSFPHYDRVDSAAVESLQLLLGGPEVFPVQMGSTGTCPHQMPDPPKLIQLLEPKFSFFSSRPKVHEDAMMGTGRLVPVLVLMPLLL